MVRPLGLVEHRGLGRMIRIEVRGIEALTRALQGDFDLTPALEKAGAIVEAGWKRRVHTVTRKYQGSIGHRVSGQSVRVGPQPGFGAPRRYTSSQASRWKKPRDGTNRGDPREYAVFEDQGTRHRPGHPAAEPALEANRGEVLDALRDGIEAEIRRRFG